MAAYAITRSKNWLACFYHRIKSRSGPAKAITATARKIAVIFYNMLKEKTPFSPIDINTYHKSFEEKQISKLQKQAKALGFQLTPVLVT